MSFDFYKIIYVFITGVLLVAFELYMFRKISCRHGNTKQTFEQEENVTLRVDRHQLVAIHAGVWAAFFWLISTISFFEFFKKPLGEVFSEWMLFFSVLLLGTAMLDLSIHVLLKKTFVFLSKREMRYRIDLKEYILRLDDVASIHDTESKFVIIFNSGEKTYIDQQGLAFLGWLSPVKEYLNVIKTRIENQ